MRGRIIITTCGINEIYGQEVYSDATTDDMVDLRHFANIEEVEKFLETQAKESDFVGAEVLVLQDFDMIGWRNASGLSIAQSELAACDYLENSGRPQAAHWTPDGQHISDFFCEEDEGNYTLEYSLL